jgi:hypothetical protein
MSERSARDALDRFLTTDDADAGCAQTMDLLDAYAEMVAAGEDPERRYPGLTAHLRSCLPCADDLDGLLATIRSADREQ